MQRHDDGEARVIPVILRPCDWHAAPFGKLLATPEDGHPVIKWPTLDDAFLDITKAIRKAVEETRPAPEAKHVPDTSPLSALSTPSGLVPSLPRSANLSVTKRFTDHDKDSFLHETFDYIANYIEGSLTELTKRQPNIKTDFRRIDANTLTATIYMDGDKKSFGKIFMGGMFGNGINFSSSEYDSGNSIMVDGSLSVGNDEHNLFMEPLGMSAMYPQEQSRQLTQEGAAEFYWNKLMEPLQCQERT